MKRVVVGGITTGLLSFVAASVSFAGPITAGNILVNRFGDGSATLSSTAAPIAVLEYAPGGSLAQTLASQFTGSNLLTDAGSSASDGYMNVNGGYLAVPGWNVAVGTAGVTSSNLKATNIIDLSTGNVVSRTTWPSTAPIPYTGNNFRSVVPTGASSFYTAGTGGSNTGGIWYNPNGLTSGFTQISNQTTGTAAGQSLTLNMRAVEIYNNQVYMSTGSGTSGIYAVGTGLSTSGPQGTTAVIQAAGASPYGFVMFDTNQDNTLDLMYVADDRAALGGGISKWTFNGSTWSTAWALLVNTNNNTLGTSTGTGIVGLLGLGGSYSGGVATLYASTNQNSNNLLVSITDNGTQPTTFSTVASAGANYRFTGVDVVPVPEPGMGVALAGVGLAIGGIWLRRISARR